MNTTCGNTSANIWKRLKFQHISLVCGLTLATGVAVTGGAWESGAAQTSPRVVLRPASPALHLALERLQREAVVAARDAVDLGAAHDLVAVLITPNGVAAGQSEESADENAAREAATIAESVNAQGGAYGRLDTGY